MDWQYQLIALFVYISKHYEYDLWTYAERLSPNNKPKFSDTEVITIYIWGVMQGHKQVRKIYKYTQDHLLDWFFHLPAYATYIQRLNRLSELFVPLISHLQAYFPDVQEKEFIRLIDSMPIMIAKGQRSTNARVAKEFANKGYNSTKKTYYHGVNLTILGLLRQAMLI